MKVFSVIAAAALSVTLAGCSSSSATTARTAARNTPIASSSPTPSAVGLSDSDSTGGGQFCADARALGLEQISLGDSSALDASVLPKLDVLAAKAPAPIASDFKLFVTIEHALLGGGTPDPVLLQKIDSPDTASRMANVASYLARNCGIQNKEAS